MFMQCIMAIITFFTSDYMNNMTITTREINTGTLAPAAEVGACVEGIGVGVAVLVADGAGVAVLLMLMIPLIPAKACASQIK
jgi:hypothetical protein